MITDKLFEEPDKMQWEGGGGVGANFDQISTVIRNWFGFASLWSLIGPENLRHSPNQLNSNYHQSRLNHPRYSALQSVCSFLLEISLRYFHCSDWLFVFFCSLVCRHSTIKRCKVSGRGFFAYVQTRDCSQTRFFFVFSFFFRWTINLALRTANQMFKSSNPFDSQDLVEVN